MSTRSRERIYGSAVRAAAARAKEARKEADRLAVDCVEQRSSASAVRQREGGPIELSLTYSR